MKAFILPISGGGFPVQLAMILDTKIKPDLMLTASGGNVAAYLALASNFDKQKLYQIIPHINREMFVRGPALSIIFRDGYEKGTGIKDFFHQIFTKESIQEVEIITLTFNMTRVCPCVFSNRSQETSYIRELAEMDNILYQSRLTHLDGDLDGLSTICMASAAIPSFVPSEIFLGEEYQDGGVCYSSAFTPVSFSIKENSPRDELMQLIYFGSYELTKIKDIIHYAHDRAKRMYEQVHYSLLEERGLILHFFDCYQDKTHVECIGKIKRHHLHQLLKDNENNNYLLILEPDGVNDIDIFNFSYQDIVNVIENIQYHGYLIKPLDT